MKIYKKVALTATAITALASTSSAAVQAHFKDNGSGGVTITWSGTLEIDNASVIGIPVDGVPAFILPAGTLSNDTLFGTPNSGQSASVFNIGGIANFLLPASLLNESANIASSAGVFGFLGGSVYFSEDDVISTDTPNPGAATKFEISLTQNFVTFDGVTMAQLTADGLILENSANIASGAGLLFQTPGGDTITAVPEPSSTALLGLGSLALLLRRRR